MLLRWLANCSLGGLGGEGTSLFEGGVQVTGHVEGGLGVFVTGTGQQGAEAVNCALQVDEHTWVASEDLGHVEGLGEETFDLTGTSDGKLVFFGEIVHTENGDDILERSVVLDELLHATRAVVVDLADDGWVQHTRGGVERIDGRVDTESGQITRQHSRGIQMGESGGWGGICQIISRYIDGLHRGDGAGSGGSDTLLEGTHIGGERGLISDGGWDTSEQSGHLRAGLGESEDVVDEEQHILVLLISEVLSDRETCQTDTGSGTRWLVHLTVHEGGLRSRAIRLDDTGLDHFVVEIVALTSSFADTGEHGETTV